MKKIDEPVRKDTLHMSNRQANNVIRQNIEAAMLLLMREKAFSDITITELIKRAGVSRVSYYRNYDSKESVLENYLDRFVFRSACILAQFDSTRGMEQWLLLLEMTRSSADEYKLFMDAGFGDTILRRFIAALDRDNTEHDKEVHAKNCYLAGAFFAVITQWVKDGMDTEASVVAKVANDLMLKGLS